MTIRTVLCLIFFALQVSGEFSAVNDVVFYMRTKEEPSADTILKFQDKKSLDTSGIDPKKPTTIQIHGYTEDHKSRYHLKLSEALLQANDQNLIFVDWGAGARTLVYKRARNEVENVGKVVAQQLDFLNEKIGLNFTSVTVIGFSLGAHIAGFTGKRVKNGKIGVIVGLDPAGPLFDINNPQTRLSANDGDYVIAVHTGYPYGIRKSIANLDFFFNTGEKQPGCLGGGWIDACSHIRAVIYYTESVKNPESFWGIRCASESQALNGKCSDQPNAFLGNPKSAKGIFSIRTNSTPPYGLGQTE